MNLSETKSDDKYFNLLKELSEKTKAKRKYIKPIENLLSFFLDKKVKVDYQHDFQLYITKECIHNHKRNSYMIDSKPTKKEKYFLNIEFKRDDFFEKNGYSLKIYISITDKESIFINSTDLKFYQYLAKYGKELEILLDGWDFEGGKECI